MRSSSLTKSQFSVMSYQRRMLLHMVIPQNVVYHLRVRDFILLDEITISTIGRPKRPLYIIDREAHMKGLSPSEKQ